MKCLLMIYFNEATWDGLSEAEHQQVFDGHDSFIKLVTESAR
ncbi:MAG TPA: hypothetical protein VFX16_22370 [Pseudonocardiaceae bacterium]|nr:hypothetical protein [Pseudonocardiaceae bacterium]